MTTSRIGRGALVTLGAAASMAWAAGAANACVETPHPPSTPKPPAPTNHKPDHLCKVSDDDVQYAVSDQAGNAVGGWHSTKGFYRTPDEPTYGYVVQLNPGRVAEGCTGSVPISLASYDTDAENWEDTGLQTFVDFATTTLSTASKTSTTAHLTVKLPGAAGGKCYGQIDLYPGSDKYDGHDKQHALPDHSHDVWTPPTPFTAWNGSDTAGTCGPSTGGSSTPPPTTGTTTTPPTTPPTTHPSTPVSSAPPAAPKPSSSTGTSTPSTPATTTSPGTPTLAHTGANVGEVSLVALAFFGAGGTAMFASRKAKLAGARKH
ncbi:hypothetical protein [Catenulispora pinisilvae]|uniref:hypothetical protein n=1 Tax=Catenulispora pinisilvae TaxID=2705253 RepID=UPI001891A35C|nr:hypothetical protein [Catenulispora pinisilvae]